MHPELAERVLMRLGFNEAPRPDFDGLAAVYRAWCARVPFDNLRKRILLASRSPAELSNIAPDAFFDDYLTHGIGGTCWPSTLALHALLEHLQFSVHLGVAAMYRDAPNEIESHGTVLVDVDGTRYWVDTAMVTIEPLRFAVGATAGPAWRETRVERLGSGLTIKWPGIGIPGEMGCKFIDDAGTATRYRERYEASRDSSPFNTHLAASLATEARALAFMAGRRYERTAGPGTTSEVLGPVERRRVFVEEFGFSEAIIDELPPDAPL